MNDVTEQNQELVLANDQLPAHLQDRMGDDRGNEAVGGDDLTIPRIELCQSLSKCRKKSDPAYIEGIEEGMFYNNITRGIYGTSVTVVPVFYQKEFLLWRDQDLGGGFGGAFPNMVEAEAALAELEKPEEYEVVPTNQQFVLVLTSDGKVEEAVISMAKSKNKVSRDWNSLIRLSGGPRFAKAYVLTGVEAQNQQNQDFYNMTVRAAGFVSEKVFKQAEEVYALITSGAVAVDRTIDGEIVEDDDAEM